MRQDAFETDPETDWGAAVGRVFGQLAILLPLSLLLGLVFGLASAATTHWLRLPEQPMPHLELGLLLLFSFNSYALTDFIQVPPPHLPQRPAHRAAAPAAPPRPPLS